MFAESCAGSLKYTAAGGIVLSLSLMAAVMTEKDILLAELKSMCSIAFSGICVWFMASDDEDLKGKLLSMGGRVAGNLREATHVAANGVINEIKRQAISIVIPVFHVGWIDKAFSLSQIVGYGSIKATDQNFGIFQILPDPEEPSIPPNRPAARYSHKCKLVSLYYHLISI